MNMSLACISSTWQSLPEFIPTFTALFACDLGGCVQHHSCGSWGPEEAEDPT